MRLDPIHSLTVEINVITRLLVLLSALVSAGAVAQPALESPRTIRVVMDSVYAPYSFQSDDGKLQGILIDQWQAWEKKTGIKVEIEAMDWDVALRRMRAGEFDVIESIVETPERRDYFDFTPAYATVEASIYFRKDISGISDLASLKGFPIGVKTGDQHIAQLRTNGVMAVIPFQNNDAIIEAAKQQKINVFVIDDPSALYLLNRMGIEADFRHSAPVFEDALRRAVRKGEAALLNTVSEGFAAIEPGELKRIDEKWFGSTINRPGRYLTYASYAAAVAILLIAGLVAWNRTLKKGILQRTAALGESEKRFRRLIELMPVAVYVCDASGMIQSYNNRAVELWGREPQLGHPAQRYCGSLRLYSLDRKLVPHEESLMAEVLRTGVSVLDHEVLIERPDGSRITVLVNIVPLKDDDGELIGAMNCFQDVTERKKAEQTLRHSEERLRGVLDEREHLFRDLHDNIVQSIYAIGMKLEQCLRQSPEDIAAQLAQVIEDLNGLIRDVRQYIKGPEQTVLSGPVLRAELLKQIKAIATADGPQFEVDLDGDAIARLSPDEAEQVLHIAREALSNSMRHSHARHGMFALFLADGGVRLEIGDDGVGFDPRQPKQGGEGLRNLKMRAQEIAGKLEIQSAPGSGTRVILDLPKN